VFIALGYSITKLTRVSEYDLDICYFCPRNLRALSGNGSGLNLNQRIIGYDIIDKKLINYVIYRNGCD